MIITRQIMKDGDRGQCLDAIANELDERAASLEVLASVNLRIYGSGMTEASDREFRALRAAASFLRLVTAGARGLKLKATGAKYPEAVPQWILALADQARAEFNTCRPPQDFSAEQATPPWQTAEGINGASAS